VRGFFALSKAQSISDHFRKTAVWFPKRHGVSGIRAPFDRRQALCFFYLPPMLEMPVARFPFQNMFEFWGEDTVPNCRSHDSEFAAF